MLAKIKGMTSDMIQKIEQEQAEAAELKQWCDKEIAESTAKKEKDDALHLDKATARSKQLKGKAATLQNELAELAGTQSEMDKIRADEKATLTRIKTRAVHPKTICV